MLTHDDHCGVDCPQCQAASEACKVIGGFAEGIERMIAGGVFARLGFRCAIRKEVTFFDLFTRETPCDSCGCQPGEVHGLNCPVFEASVERAIAEAEKNTFVCDNCKGIFPIGDVKKAEAEAEKLWGVENASEKIGPKDEQMAVLCDDCFEKFMQYMNR